MSQDGELETLSGHERAVLYPRRQPSSREDGCQIMCDVVLIKEGSKAQAEFKLAGHLQ